MKKRILISISLLISSIICTVIGIVIIQDSLSSVLSLENASQLKVSFPSSSYYIILILVFQTVICFSFWFIIKNHLKTSSFHNDTLEFHTDVNPKEILKQQESEQQIEKIDIIKKAISNIKKIKADTLSQKEVGEQTLRSIAELLKITQGILYLADSEKKTLSFLAGYAYYKKESTTYEFGEGLAGQVAKAQRIVNIQSIPAGYIKTVSGLGESTPTNLLICPITQENKTVGVLELASFSEFEPEIETDFHLIANLIAEKLNRK